MTIQRILEQKPVIQDKIETNTGIHNSISQIPLQSDRAFAYKDGDSLII